MYLEPNIRCLWKIAPFPSIQCNTIYSITTYHTYTGNPKQPSWEPPTSIDCILVTGQPTPFSPFCGDPARLSAVRPPTRSLGDYSVGQPHLFLKLENILSKYSVQNRLPYISLWDGIAVERSYDHAGNSSDPSDGCGMPNFSSNLTGWGVGGLSDILCW